VNSAAIKLPNKWTCELDTKAQKTGFIYMNESLKQMLEKNYD
jgi:hypothetical protein